VKNSKNRKPKERRRQTELAKEIKKRTENEKKKRIPSREELKEPKT
jgi:hypothetical protein